MPPVLALFSDSHYLCLYGIKGDEDGEDGEDMLEFGEVFLPKNISSRGDEDTDVATCSISAPEHWQRRLPVKLVHFVQGCLVDSKNVIIRIWGLEKYWMGSNITLKMRSG